MKGIDAEIDRLYQLPLEEFTAARNVLAKRAGADGPRIRELGKPSVPAWAVNQLYWQNREEWDALVAAAENLRRAHKAVLAGREGDVRAAGKVHDDAVESALKATLTILTTSPHPVTDATRQGVLNTLRAWPADDAHPGRLSKTLQPGGFEVLAGFAVTGGTKAAHTSKTSKSHVPAPKERDEPPPRAARDSRSKADARAVTAARQDVASSERALREAEQGVRRDEFESARAMRDERRTAAAVEKARAAVDEAKAELERAEAAFKTARDQREEIENRIPKARAAVTAAEKRAQAAAAALRNLTARD